MRRSILGQTSAEEFIETWRSASSVAHVARRLGLSHSYCSVRASRLRAEGHDLPMMRVTHAKQLPLTLQVMTWEWCRAPLLKRTHRRMPGSPIALCGRELGEGARRVAERNGRHCRKCWPVHLWPPTIGAVADGVLVIAERTIGRCVLLGRAENGSMLDVETGEPWSGPVRRSWAL